MVLPVETTLPLLLEVLQVHRNAVLQAPPGAGKTTRVPLALLSATWLEDQRVVMLEPRRLAARAAARYMARQLGEEVGDTVGYRVRLDTRVSARTRIEVVTEGVLTRMLQSDPALEGVGLVIFDEVHERNLQADLALALTLQARSQLRPDLAILAMSATLQSERLAALLNAAPIITSEGRVHPVHTEYLARPVKGRPEGLIVQTVVQALAASGGDILVFLPGMAEIQRVHAQLLESNLPGDTTVHPLYGNLSGPEQDRAIAPSSPGRRKVVLATSIAETSLTIEGVRIVIDSGLMRVPRFSPRTGMTRLETMRVTRASADQRRGRAGRTGPGICYRLWTQSEHATLLEHGQPEIMQADLAPLALDLAAWGEHDPHELRWLDAPPSAAYAQARELLQSLAALDDAQVLTAHGRRMAALPLHPRLAHMVLRAQELGMGGLAADLAALLNERDILRGVNDPDINLRLHALQGARSGADAGALQRVRAEAREIRRWSGQHGSRAMAAPPLDPGLLLALAYPDRIAQRRPGTRGRFLMRNGRGATVEPASPLASSEYLVAAQVDDRGADTRVFLAAALAEQHIETQFGDQLTILRELEWDPETLIVRGRERVQLGAIVITERSFQPAPEEQLATWLAAVRDRGLDVLRWPQAAVQLRQRLRFLHALEIASTVSDSSRLNALDRSWPDVSDSALLERLEEWLAPALRAQRTMRELDLTRALEQLLSWQQRRTIDELAPTHVTVPSGSRIPIDYSDPDAPALSVRLQEVFGWLDTPRVAGGRVPLVLHLLSPAHRPVQVTRDLASFWKTGYFEVKKDLKGRYPKHYWPDDPIAARPTRRVRPRD